MAVLCNRPARGAGAPSDEVTSHPTVAPHALVSPVTYDLTEIGVRVRLSKPRIVSECRVKDGVTHYWFPTLGAFGRSGKMVSSALLGGDNSENAVDVVERTYSTDHGLTWSSQLQWDDIGFTPNEVYDPSTGRVYWFASRGKPSPTSQNRDFTFDYGYYAVKTNGKLKTVSYPHGSTLTGLPWDIAVYTKIAGLPPLVNNYAPRRVWNHIYWDCRPLVCQDGSWLAAIYVIRAGQTGMTPIIMRSTDKGANWVYRSVVPILANDGTTVVTTENQCNESSLMQLPNGHIMYAARCDNGNVVWYYNHSSDMGLTWTNGVGPRNAVGGAGVGFTAPSLLRLDNGIVVCVSGRQNASTVDLGMGVCADGTEGGAGLGGYSRWQRLDMVAHHNSFDEGAALDVPNKVRAFGIPTNEKSMLYLEIVQQSANRAFITYDRCPFNRQTVRAGDDQNPNQIVGVDAEFTLI